MSKEQIEFYQHVTAKHSFIDIRNNPDWYKGEGSSADWLQVDSIDGIDYYTPNDEDWGSILAVSQEHKLAHKTDFFEMDDMACPVPGDDYKQVISNGTIMCKFEVQ